MKNMQKYKWLMAGAIIAMVCILTLNVKTVKDYVYVYTKADNSEKVFLNTTTTEALTTENSSDENNLKSYEGESAPVPTLLFKSAVSIWVNASDKLEYGIRPLNSEEEYEWQTGNLFFALSEHTTYEIVARYKETADTKAGGMSSSLVVMTDSWTYSLRYDCKGGKNNSGNVTRFQNGQQGFLLASPERAGYLFGGWYLESSFQNKVTAFDCNLAKDQHLYAKWEKISTSKVTGVTTKTKSGNKLYYSFTKKKNAVSYEVQYSTSEKFTDAETVTVTVTKNNVTTDTLTKGMTYYVRVRAVMVDSTGNNIYSNYSTIHSKKLKASSTGTANMLSAGAKKKESPKEKIYKKSTQYLLVNESISLKVPDTVKSKKKNANKLICTSSNSKIAKVNTKGKVTAKAAGKAKITIKRGNIKFVYTIVVEKVSINYKKADMVVGDTISLVLSGTSKKAVYKTSNSKKATVNSKGQVTAKGAGEATITATYRGHKYTCKLTIITVEAHKIASVSDFYFASIKRIVPLYGGTVALNYQVSPAERTGSEIAWYSSNPSVALVKNGILTPVSEGITEISVKYKNGTAKMKVQVAADADLSKNVKVICHRGGNEAPENSLEAFRKAAKAGYEYVETDIRWTKDNVPVLIHDSTVGRTSNAIANLSVSELTYKECMELDFGSYFGKEYTGTKIVRFDDFLALCKQLGLKPYVELKGAIYYEKASLLARLVEHYEMTGQVTWISFSYESLASVAELLPQARLGYLSNSLTENVINTAVKLQTGSNEVFLDILYNQNMELSALRLAGNNGMDVEFYTIDEVSLALSAIACGGSGITTNTLKKTMLVSNSIESRETVDFEMSEETSDNITGVQSTTAETKEKADATEEKAGTTEEKAGTTEEATVTTEEKNTTEESDKQEDTTTYKITYVLYGGSNAAENPKEYQESDTSITLKKAQKAGYKFAGWYQEKTYQNKVKCIDCSLGKDITLYAKYEIVTYAIDYKLYGGTFQDNYVSSYTVSSDTIYFAVPMRDGYTFEGWYDNANMEGNPQNCLVHGSYGVKTYYAKWSLNQYTITYHLNGGTKNSANPDSYTYLSSSVSLQPSSRKGYTFSGWYTDKACTKKITKLSAKSTGNKELYAKWKKVEVGKVGKVTLKKNGTYLTISYGKIAYAKGYEIVYYKKGNAKKAVTVSLNQLKYTLLKCKPKATYCVKVRAYCYDSQNKRIYGKYSKVYKCKMSS